MAFPAKLSINYTRNDNKSGGANAGDNRTAIYKSKNSNIKALVKLDTKNNKPLIAKVISERVAAKIMDAILSKHHPDLAPYAAKIDYLRFVDHNLLPAPNNKEEVEIEIKEDFEVDTEIKEQVDDVVKEIEPEKEDESGKNTYICSELIPRYQDLWSYAYKKHYETTFQNQLLALKTRQECEARITHFQNELRKLNVDEADSEILNLPLVDDPCDRAITIKKIAKGYADLKANQLKRPAASFPDSLPLKQLIERAIHFFKRTPGPYTPFFPRKIVNSTLKSALLKPFAEIATTRLLFEYGGHNANIGIVERIDERTGKLSLHVASIDYGAAFDKLGPKINPYKPQSYSPDKIYKNHFTDYGKSIIQSETMALAFIEASKYDKSAINSAVDEAIDQTVSLYSIRSLRLFAEHLGMPELTSDNKDFCGEAIKEFIKTRLQERQKDSAQIGQGLLFELCLNLENKTINQRQLNHYLKTIPTFNRFMKNVVLTDKYDYQKYSSLNLNSMARQEIITHLKKTFCQHNITAPLRRYSGLIFKQAPEQQKNHRKFATKDIADFLARENALFRAR